jgi:hypothetical protein
MDMPHQHEIESLLIALPKGFGFRNYFKSKLDRVLSETKVGRVTVIQDELSIAKDYFSPLGTPVQQNEPYSRLTQKKKLTAFSHAIIFWDGDDLSDLVFAAKVTKIPLRLIPIEITKIANKDRGDAYDIYIGRGTPWGNPFPIDVTGKGDTREDVIRKYKAYFDAEFLSNPEKHKALLSLRGYRLACHCKPMACHGDIIAAYLNSYEGESKSTSSD